jgi:hypothetical protein
MHEHYEDTPWREQSLYAMDARNQALCGYYAFGEYEFSKASIELLGAKNVIEEYIQLTAPGELNFTIPVFSLSWIMMLEEYVLFSGDLGMAKNNMSKVDRMIDCFSNDLVDGLVSAQIGSSYWHFYEWSEGLDAAQTMNSPLDPSLNRFDAGYNAFFALALKSAKALANHIGKFELGKKYDKLYSGIKHSFNEKFFNQQKMLYCSYEIKGEKEHYSELIQALSLCAGICEKSNAIIIRSVLADDNNDLVKISLSNSLFKFEALLQDRKYSNRVLDLIEKTWGYMLYNKATTFWETIKGADYFEFAGSLCHGWSAIPLYVYYAYYLGVRPIEPGFKKYSFRPLFSDLRINKGKVPTPCGDIKIKRILDNGKIDYILKSPKGLKEM